MVVPNFLVSTIIVWFLSFPVATLCVSSSTKETEAGDAGGHPHSCPQEENHHHQHQQQQQQDISSSSRVPDECQLVYARVPDTDDQWATYTMIPRKKGTNVRKHGDIVIQWTDPEFPNYMDDESYNYDRTLLHQYPTLRGLTWNGQETGGQYEGKFVVESIVTGIGMVAQSTTNNGGHNVLPLVPRVDEGSLTRFDSPGAGATTSYHNLTWWFSKDLEAGDELLYSHEGKKTTIPQSGNGNVRKRPSLEYLKENAYCMDNLFPRKSRVKEAGRGTYATRDLLKDSIVGPVPVALVHRDELRSKTNHNDQLLLNYCLGHNSSNWLLFPYSPIINLINHYNVPNVELQWSAPPSSNINQNDNKKIQPMMLLELVATRPIQKGEEIYLNYGKEWEDAWWKHDRDIWKPSNTHYTPSYVMDDAIRMMRTEQEQKEHPYPDNLFTSCFYRYSDRSEEERATGQNSKKKDSITSFRWHLTKGLYDLKNFRPCQVLKRMEDNSGRSAYAARILNRPGLDITEIIPKDELHVVTHIPRAAIQFSDKAYTTDQHLKYAFRHEIGLPEELIPSSWKIKDQPAIDA